MDLTGSPQRLYLFQLGTSTMPTPQRTIVMSSGCYLVQTNADENILIDSGLPPDYTPPPGTPETEHSTNVIRCLRDIGLDPGDIDTVICTHFDIDHVGHHRSFPTAEFIVQREHYELARAGHPRFAATSRYWDDPRFHFRLVDGDVDLVPGLTVVKTPGHAPAHQSVLVRLPETGSVLLAIDAVMMSWLFTVDRVAWPMDDNEAELRASTQKLLDMAERESVALVIFGHDGEQWKSLTKAPGYYA